MTSHSPPPTPDDIRDSLCHLETIHARLHQAQREYISRNAEFWFHLNRLAGQAPPPEPADDSARFWAGLLARLTALAREGHFIDSLQTSLDMNSDRADLALEALRLVLAARATPS